MNIQQVQEIVARHAASTTGQLAVGFRDFATGESFVCNETEHMPMASTFKIFVLAEIFRRVQAGELSLETRYELGPQIKSPGTGVLYFLRDGLMPTLYDYCYLMMVLSDNTAADFLFQLAGRENIYRNVLEPLGLKDTKCDWTCRKLLCEYLRLEEPTAQAFGQAIQKDWRNDPFFVCQTQENDETTVADMMAMLDALYRGAWVDQETSSQMLDIMKLCQTNSRIPKYLTGVPVAHKTGTIDLVVNDVGIVYTPKGDYMLTLFYNGNKCQAEEYQANRGAARYEAMLAQLSLEIYQAYLNN